MIHATRWINPKNIVLSERSQSQKEKLYVVRFHSYEVSTKRQIHRDRGNYCSPSVGKKGVGY